MRFDRLGNRHPQPGDGGLGRAVERLARCFVDVQGRQHQHGSRAETDDAADLEGPHLHRPADTLLHQVVEDPCGRGGALGRTAAHDAGAQHDNRPIAEHHGCGLA